MSEFKIINEELAQSKTRVVFCWVCLIGFLIMSRFNELQNEAFITVGLVCYLVFSTLWYEIIKRNPNRYLWRRNISLVADIGIMAAFFHQGGGQVAIYYPIFLWVIIGNGIRFGEVYLQRGIVIGAIGFGSVLYSNSYWNSHLDVGMGLLLGVVVLPIFYQSALRRLRNMNELKVELAKSRLAEKAKDRFLASMSHEIRTPMNGVLGMAESLSKSDLDADQRDQLGVITSSMESLLRTIGDILDYAGMTNDKLALVHQDFDLHQTLGDVIRLFRTSANERNLDLVFDYATGAPRTFMGDSARIRQVAFHLLSNAFKFTEKGRVRLTCQVKEAKSGCQVMIAVTDTGIGMAPGHVKTLFKEFEQADNSTTRRYEGLGLGLGLIKQLTELMGGELCVESTEGTGSTFTVTLPLKRTEAAPAPAQIENIRDGEFDLRALVVEDNKFNQVVMKRLLGLLGVKALVAENGAEALTLMDRESFDLVLMDIRMPVMNGYEATLKIRAQETETDHIPIIAVTADATNQVEQRCREVGMDAFLAKPLALGSLAATIEAVMLDAKKSSRNSVPC